MDDEQLLRASARERALYGELGAVYRDLAGALAVREAAADPAWLASRNDHAEQVTHELREIGAVLAPARLDGAPVPPAVQDLWRESATLAADAARENARLADLALERRADIGMRLARLGAGRRALARYRPADPTTPGRRA